jgi:rhodanese-related sulfurtransferase
MYHSDREDEMNMTRKSTQNKAFLWIGIFVVLALIARTYLLLTGDQTKNAGVPVEVSVQEALEMKNEGAFILDVRQPEEWNQGHIEGATLIPLGDLAGRVNELPKDQEIVVVCRSGNRSAQGRDILREAGLVNSTSMAGGMNDWVGAGYPAVTGP